MPWLTATAFLHSVMIQEGKGGMKVWNFLLIFFTFLLVIYATFLTRSGIIQSVHAFAQSPIGTYFIVFMLLISISSLGLLTVKLDKLKSRNIFEAYLSKETAFLFNNLVFIVLTIVIFYGTTFPLVSEAIRGYQVSVRAGYYNEAFLPLAVVLISLMGICPLIAWRRASISSLKRNFTYPLIVTVGALIGALISGIRDVGGLLAFSISAFVTSIIVQEFYRGLKAEGNAKGLGYIKNLLRATGRNRRKYGGYIIHLSIIMVLIGVAGSSLYEVSMRFTLREGESFSTGDYMLKLKDVTQNAEGSKVVMITRLEIYQADQRIHEASPSITYHPRQRQWIRNVYIYSTVWNDFYLIFFGSQDGRYAFAFKVIPLVNFIWAGIAIMIFGTIIAVWPERRKY